MQKYWICETHTRKFRVAPPVANINTHQNCEPKLTLNAEHSAEDIDLKLMKVLMDETIKVIKMATRFLKPCSTQLPSH